MEDIFGLSGVFGEITYDEFQVYLRNHADELILGPRPFAQYMRARFRKKGVLQQNVFLAADLSENYGYKLISEEKHTVDRDVILRICFAARFTLAETQEALILYGMAPLYARLSRDILLISSLLEEIYDIDKINTRLLSCHMDPLSNNTV